MKDNIWKKINLMVVEIFNNKLVLVRISKMYPNSCVGCVEVKDVVMEHSLAYESIITTCFIYLPNIFFIRVLLCKFYAHIPFAKYITIILSSISLPICNVNLHITKEIKKNGEEWCTYTCCNKCLHNIRYYFLTCLT